MVAKTIVAADMNLFKKTATMIATLALTACAGSFEVAYPEAVSGADAATWRVQNVIATVPDELTTTEQNTFAPSADIVWHGEERGDRKAQVSAIVQDGITSGTAGLNGSRPVTITASIRQFHGVTPLAVARAPQAVHNIDYIMQVFDSATGAPLTAPIPVQADLEANVGAAAITAAIQGRDQRTRIVTHLAAVTAAVLGFGPDQRRTFSGLGR